MNGFLYNMIAENSTDLSAALFVIIIFLAGVFAIMVIVSIGLAIKILIDDLIIKYKYK